MQRISVSGKMSLVACNVCEMMRGCAVHVTSHFTRWSTKDGEGASIPWGRCSNHTPQADSSGLQRNEPRLPLPILLFPGEFCLSYTLLFFLFVFSLPVLFLNQINSINNTISSTISYAAPSFSTSTFPFKTFFCCVFLTLFLIPSFPRQADSS